MLAELALEARLKTETVDVTLPPRPEPVGTVHPVTQVWEEVIAIFGDMGFSVAEGPHIETDWYNFGALNMPPEHPARQEHDTFYFHPRPGSNDRMVLRTHTSPVQIRSMETMTPPIRIIAPGRTFRSDSDQTHTPMFHQVEGLVIDEYDASRPPEGDAGGLLQGVLRGGRGEDALPPFALPLHRAVDGGRHRLLLGGRRAEDRRRRFLAGDPGLRHGASERHPRRRSRSRTRYQGFAFGMGIDRIAMLKYGIPDLRAFFEADLRWLRHYGFSPLAVPSLAEGLSS